MIRFSSIFKASTQWALTACSNQKAGMSDSLQRILRWRNLVLSFIATILFIGAYMYQKDIVKMATIIEPGKLNVQLNVTLLLNNMAF